ncbi:VOC family protein [Streptomyces sp. URMC 123]|uniref:VOC family protein n=1 Tax=Streptomyces sp. URMC 123 TaxID=3423403 RepID=UPI003F1D875A
MSTQIFVNLPVKDLERSKAFFTELGYSFDSRFTDQNAACLVIDDGIYAMLLVEPFFATFTPKEIADAGRTTETIVALGVDSRERVDELADRALRAGGRQTRDPDEEDFMYARSFQDLDGHLWEVVFMDPSAMPG